MVIRRGDITPRPTAVAGLAVFFVEKDDVEIAVVIRFPAAQFSHARARRGHIRLQTVRIRGRSGRPGIAAGRVPPFACRSSNRGVPYFSVSL